MSEEQKDYIDVLQAFKTKKQQAAADKKTAAEEQERRRIAEWKSKMEPAVKLFKQLTERYGNTKNGALYDFRAGPVGFSFPVHGGRWKISLNYDIDEECVEIYNGFVSASCQGRTKRRPSKVVSPEDVCELFPTLLDKLADFELKHPGWAFDDTLDN